MSSVQQLLIQPPVVNQQAQQPQIQPQIIQQQAQQPWILLRMHLRLLQLASVG